MTDHVSTLICAVLGMCGSDNPMTIAQLEAEYKALEGTFIPAKRLGFDNTVALLRSMDSVRVTESNGRLLVQARDSPATRHIVDLIDAQKRSNQKASPWTIPPYVEDQIMIILADTPNSRMLLSQLTNAYKLYYDVKLPAPRGHMQPWLSTASLFVVTREAGKAVIEPMSGVDMSRYYKAAQARRASRRSQQQQQQQPIANRPPPTTTSIRSFPPKSATANGTKGSCLPAAGAAFSSNGSYSNQQQRQQQQQQQYSLPTPTQTPMMKKKTTPPTTKKKTPSPTTKKKTPTPMMTMMTTTATAATPNKTAKPEPPSQAVAAASKQAEIVRSMQPTSSSAAVVTKLSGSGHLGGVSTAPLQAAPQAMPPSPRTPVTTTQSVASNQGTVVRKSERLLPQTNGVMMSNSLRREVKTVEPASNRVTTVNQPPPPPPPLSQQQRPAAENVPKGAPPSLLTFEDRSKPLAHGVASGVRPFVISAHASQTQGLELFHSDLRQSSAASFSSSDSINEPRANGVLPRAAQPGSQQRRLPGMHVQVPKSPHTASASVEQSRPTQLNSNSQLQYGTARDIVSSVRGQASLPGPLEPLTHEPLAALRIETTCAALNGDLTCQSIGQTGSTNAGRASQDRSIATAAGTTLTPSTTGNGCSSSSSSSIHSIVTTPVNGQHAVKCIITNGTQVSSVSDVSAGDAQQTGANGRPLLRVSEPVKQLLELPVEKLLNLVSILQELPPVPQVSLTGRYYAAYSEELVPPDKLNDLVATLVAQGILTTSQGGAYGVNVTTSGGLPALTKCLMQATLKVNAQGDASLCELRAEQIHGRVESSDGLGFQLMPVRRPLDVSALQPVGQGSVVVGQHYVCTKKNPQGDVVVALECVSAPGPQGQYWQVRSVTGAIIITKDSYLYKLEDSGLREPVKPLAVWPAGRKPAVGEIVTVKVIKRVSDDTAVCTLNGEQLFSVYRCRGGSQATLAVLRWGGLLYVLDSSLKGFGVDTNPTIPVTCLQYPEALAAVLERHGITTKSSVMAVTDFAELLAQRGARPEFILDLLRL